MHHVSDVQVEYPIILLVFNSQYCLHIVSQRREIA